MSLQHPFHLLFGGEKGGCAYAGNVVDSGAVPDLLEAVDYFYLNSKKGYMRQGVFSSEECAAQEGVNEWLAEAKSEDECVGEDSGRYVCYLPGMRFTLGFFYNKEDCECLGGKYKSSTVWEMGVWKEPKFIPFVWNEEQQRAHYEWVDALSFEVFFLFLFLFLFLFFSFFSFFFFLYFPFLFLRLFFFLRKLRDGWLTVLKREQQLSLFLL